MPKYSYAGLPAVEIDALKDAIVEWKRSVCDQGKILVEAKARLHRLRRPFQAWVRAELGISTTTAERCMRVFRIALINGNLPLLSKSAAYLMAAHSTPKTVRDLVRRKIAAGEKPSHREIRQLIVTARRGKAHRSGRFTTRAGVPVLRYSPSDADPGYKRMETSQGRPTQRDADAQTEGPKAVARLGEVAREMARKRDERLTEMAAMVLDWTADDDAERARFVRLAEADPPQWPAETLCALAAEIGAEAACGYRSFFR